VLMIVTAMPSWERAANNPKIITAHHESVPRKLAACSFTPRTDALTRFLEKLPTTTAVSIINAANFLGTLSWWAVIIFGLLAALSQLGIAVTIINTLVTGLVVMVALAGGIAFGLGGKDYASHLIKKFREQVEE